MKNNSLTTAAIFAIIQGVLTTIGAIVTFGFGVMWLSLNGGGGVNFAPLGWVFIIVSALVMGVAAIFYVGASKIFKYNNGTGSIESVKTWGIVMLIFGILIMLPYIITGLFGLLAGILAITGVKQPVTATNHNSHKINNIEEVLDALRQLYDRGLITEEEYKNRRLEAIKSI